MDVNGDGLLTQEEFESGCQLPSVIDILASVGIDVSDAAALFDIIDKDESGQLTPAEFCSGLMRARTQATGRDLLELQCDIWRLTRERGKAVDGYVVQAEAALARISSKIDTLHGLYTSPSKPSPVKASQLARSELRMGQTWNGPWPGELSRRRVEGSHSSPTGRGFHGRGDEIDFGGGGADRSYLHAAVHGRGGRGHHPPPAPPVLPETVPRLRDPGGGPGREAGGRGFNDYYPSEIPVPLDEGEISPGTFIA